MLKWEEIEHTNGFSLGRAKVFGGWLVKAMDDVQTQTNQGFNQTVPKTGYEWRTSITFVPDPNHEWEI